MRLEIEDVVVIGNRLLELNWLGIRTGAGNTHSDSPDRLFSMGYNHFHYPYSSCVQSNLS